MFPSLAMLTSLSFKNLFIIIWAHTLSPLTLYPREEATSLFLIHPNRENVVLLGFFFFFLVSYLFLAVLRIQCCLGFSLVAVIRGKSIVAVASGCRAWALGWAGFSSCALGLWSPGSILWHTGFLLRGMQESSGIGDWIHVSGIGRQILYHWASREAQHLFLNVICLPFKNSYC